MSHHKTCPFCGRETRCPWEERDVEEPCYECAPTYAAGYEAAYREMWRVAMLAEADRVESWADDQRWRSNETWVGSAERKKLRDDAKRGHAEATQLRAWAREGA